ncbi:hypothetical protein B0H63DRAFT_406421 [Podospora didyma]|uniref:SET domain-containing protein n=1 Tax=Podospora didyma TaxID=330526 RepID=A0AAE0P4R9_9PEZI|nr:hypothetical protein B0H63DRAFT_406421 [Podospora didyma]
MARLFALFFVFVLDFLSAAYACKTSHATDGCLWSPLVTKNELTCDTPWSRRRQAAGGGAFGAAKKQDELLSEEENDDEAKPSVWQGPANCNGRHCIFWNEGLSGGIALITTSHNAQLIASWPTANDVLPESPPFYAAQIPGKGTGLIANRTIRKGEIVMQRTAALVINVTPHYDLDPETREEFYRQALDKLPPRRRAAFMEQMGDDVYAKVDRNAFRMVITDTPGATRKDENKAHLGNFLGVSWFNHDCRPNTHYRINNITHTTVAVREIAPGEEITVTYVDGTLRRAERQKRLDDWGFKCTCPQCSLPPDEAEESDRRLEALKMLGEELEERVRTPGGLKEMMPEMGGRLAELYEQERLDSYLGHAYTRAALVYSMFEDVEKTTEYAAKAAVAVARENGDDFPDAVAMRSLASHPQSHWSWGIGKELP